MNKGAIKVIGSVIWVLIFASALIYQIVGSINGSSLLDIF